MKEDMNVVEAWDELNKWRRQRKILNFMMCFFLFFFFGSILRGCYLKHEFDGICAPGQFESYREQNGKKWVVCSDLAREDAWVEEVKKSGR